MHRPHHLEPKKATARVILAVKNFAAIKGVCHIGLGVTATNTMKVLRRDGYLVEAWPLQRSDELHNQLVEAEKRVVVTGGLPVSHVIVSAPWIDAKRFKQFCLDFPNIEFVLLNHSGCAFLSIDFEGMVKNLGYMHLELQVHNFRLAANNTRVVKLLAGLDHAKCLYLPNLYDTESYIPGYRWPKEIGNTIRIGSFGAGRPWKNQLCAAEAAILIARQLGKKLELFVNSKRPDGGERMIEEREKFFNKLSGVTITYVPWQMWPEFRRTCHQMHLLLQPSFDETFNVVTADGIASGIPSVTSSSIEWTPQRWQATCEDPTDIQKVGMYLLNDPDAVEDGRTALRDYVTTGLNKWRDYLGR